MKLPFGFQLNKTVFNNSRYLDVVLRQGTKAFAFFSVGREPKMKVHSALIDITVGSFTLYLEVPRKTYRCDYKLPIKPLK